MLGADEQGSAHHQRLARADSLDGIPVVIADLHSALPAVLAAYFADAAPDRPPRSHVTPGVGWSQGHDLPGPPPAAHSPGRGRLRDAGRRALPIWFSRTAAALREIGWLAGTITVGQAFGGDLEAVTLHSGLLAARHVLGAELVVVAQGPGNLGTGTRWGFSGVVAGEAVNAAAVLGGTRWRRCGSATPTRGNGTR